MNAHGIEIKALVPGDVIVVVDGLEYQEEREVVRVVDIDGRRGGVVDTKPVGGRYGATTGFRFGDQVVRVERMADTRADAVTESVAKLRSGDRVRVTLTNGMQFETKFHRAFSNTRSERYIATSDEIVAVGFTMGGPEAQKAIVEVFGGSGELWIPFFKLDAITSDIASADLDDLLDVILTEWRKSTRTSANTVERTAIEISNRKAARA